MAKTEKVKENEGKFQEVNLEGTGSAVFTVTRKFKYMALVSLKIDGVEYKIGDEIENFDSLRERTKRALLNLNRVKVVN